MSRCGTKGAERAGCGPAAGVVRAPGVAADQAFRVDARRQHPDQVLPDSTPADIMSDRVP